MQDAKDDAHESASRSMETISAGALTHERDFVENLMCQRFNFLLVTFSVVLAGAINVKSSGVAALVLFVGAVICTLVSLTVYRIYLKLDCILKRLHDIPSHPVAICGADIRKLGRRALFGNVWIIGWVVPAICCVTLMAGFVIALCNHWSSPNKPDARDVLRPHSTQEAVIQ